MVELPSAPSAAGLAVDPRAVRVEPAGAVELLVGTHARAGGEGRRAATERIVELARGALVERFDISTNLHAFAALRRQYFSKFRQSDKSDPARCWKLVWTLY